MLRHLCKTASAAHVLPRDGVGAGGNRSQSGARAAIAAEPHGLPMRIMTCEKFRNPEPEHEKLPATEHDAEALLRISRR
jgi:type VI protein secretion system component VasA